MRLLQLFLAISQVALALARLHIPRNMIKHYSPPADFCEKFTCKKENHPYCHNGTYKSDAEIIGPQPEFTHLDIALKLKIVRRHNSYRNIIACSNKSLLNLNKERFPNAARMNELAWDNELEFVADKIARTCQMDMSFCPYTPTYPNAGKVMLKRAYSTSMSQIDVVGDMLEALFLSYVNIPIKVVEEYNGSQPIRKTLYNFTNMEIWELKEMGVDLRYILKSFDFLQIVQEDTSKVGCSFYECGRKRGQYQHMFVCVYDLANKDGKMVYKVGDYGGRLCKRKSTEHCCLCDTGEGKPKEPNATAACKSAEIDFEVAKFHNKSHLFRESILFIFIGFLFGFISINI